MTSGKCPVCGRVLHLIGDKKEVVCKDCGYVFKMNGSAENELEFFCSNPPCPKCGADVLQKRKIESFFGKKRMAYKCLRCSYKWKVKE